MISRPLERSCHGQASCNCFYILGGGPQQTPSLKVSGELQLARPSAHVQTPPCRGRSWRCQTCAPSACPWRGSSPCCHIPLSTPLSAYARAAQHLLHAPAALGRLYLPRVPRAHRHYPVRRADAALHSNKVQTLICMTIVFSVSVQSKLTAPYDHISIAILEHNSLSHLNICFDFMPKGVITHSAA